jgi:hypothetical protein
MSHLNPLDLLRKARTLYSQAELASILTMIEGTCRGETKKPADPANQSTAIPPFSKSPKKNNHEK